MSVRNLKIIAVEEKSGGYSGFFKDRPDILAEGDDYEGFVKNLKGLRKTVEKFESKSKNKVENLKKSVLQIKKMLKNEKK